LSLISAGKHKIGIEEHNKGKDIITNPQPGHKVVYRRWDPDHYEEHINKGNLNESPPGVFGLP